MVVVVMGRLLWECAHQIVNRRCGQVCCGHAGRPSVYSSGYCWEAAAGA